MSVHDMHRYHPARRARIRAHSLLLSHQGCSIPHIARFYQVDRRSVSTWIDRWQTRGLVGLYDQPGSGRRPLLNDAEQQKVHAYLSQYPKDIKKVVQAWEQETTKRVSTKTIKRFIKKTRVVKLTGVTAPQASRDRLPDPCESADAVYAVGGGSPERGAALARH